MPGKHAPESPTSFYLSVGRAVGGALVVLGVVAAIAIAATGGGGKKPTGQASTPPPTVSTNATTSSTPSSSVTPSVPATSSLASITVDVLNGTQRPGLAKALSDKLRAEGYTIKKVATQTTHQSLTTIYYKAGNKAAADTMLANHPELKRVAQAPALQTETLTVVIGDDYKAA